MSKIKIKNSNQKIADILLKIGCVNINFKKNLHLRQGKKALFTLIVENLFLSQKKEKL